MARWGHVVVYSGQKNGPLTGPVRSHDEERSLDQKLARTPAEYWGTAR